jgi:ABC-type uncharacterized transport system substrate-binding protein
MHVPDIARRLFPGVFLIGAISSVLLLSDRDRRQGAGAEGWHKKSIYFIQLNNVSDVEEAERGVRDSIRSLGLAEHRDYEINVLNAQGDMASLGSLIDAAVSGNADLIITFSTPTLQAALRRAGTKPVVFTYVANAVIAGAGRSDTDHLPNVTGVNTNIDFDNILLLLKQVFPKLHRVGTMFVPAEVNMVYFKDKLADACKKAGVELESMGAATSSEVGEAAAALCARHIDAICQIPGNLTGSSFPSIVHAASQVHVPIMGTQKVHGDQGAVLVAASDWYALGFESGRMAVRVLKGESPAGIPFGSLSAQKLYVNPIAARKEGVQIPPALLREATLIQRPEVAGGNR